MRPGPFGAPLAPLYRTITAARRLAYDRDWLQVTAANRPTFSIGALEAGGTGKTPIARWLLRALVERGHHPGLLTRGYGRRSKMLEIHDPGAEPDPDRIGDEPALIASEVPVPIAAFGDRVAGARALQGSVDCFVLDDGFSHRRIARDLDVVVLRAEVSPYRLHHLPWGPLRESAAGLARADVFWIHGEQGHADTAAELEVRFPNTGQVWSRPRSVGGEGLEGVSVVIATGIARPDRVAASAERLGARVEDVLIFPDHHRFGARDVERIARASGGRMVVSTAKDAVKLRRLGAELVVLDVEVDVIRGAQSFLNDQVEPVFEQQAGTASR